MARPRLSAWRPVRLLRTVRSGPVEGWAILLLHAGIVATAASVVARSEWVEIPAELAVVAAAGAVVGFVLAKTSCPDVLAHVTATLVGLWVVTFEVVSLFPALGVGRQERLAALIERGQVWYRATTSLDQRDDPILFVLVLALTLWLVAYLSAWTLFRRRWLLVSLLLPGFLVLVMLGYSPGLGSGPVALLLTLSGILSARYFAFRRQQVWTRFRIPAPPGLAARFLSIGSVLVIATLALAWTLPISADSAAVDRLKERAEGPAGAVADWWLNAVPDLSGANDPDAGSYASFGDSFELGGELDLSDAPAVALRGVGDPRYLVGLRYDAYTGRGWESDVAATFDPVGPDGTTYSPQLTFRPEQNVQLSEEILNGTSTVEGDVTMLRPKGELLFTVDTFLRSDVATSVQLSWQQLEGVPFDLSSGDRDALPTDLRALASLLLLADGFGGSQLPDGSPAPNDPDLARRLQAEQLQLAARFLSTRWEVGRDGAVTLFVAGQLPTYDDIEAVYARDAVAAGGTYGVAGVQSAATPGELRNAGTDYPAYISERYLPLPDSVTQRTRDLALSLAGERTNPFDVARRIEREVRDRIRYSLDIDAPPGGRDVVDYVLFESQVGYCEYHSSAMAVLLRAAGIPARVAVGYHQVPFDPTSQAYVYKESDAHAWVEAYFPGYGWIPFEPTPSEPLRELGAAPAPPDPRPTPTPVPTRTVEPTPALDATPTADPIPTPSPEPPVVSTVDVGGSEGRGWRDWLPLGVVGIAAAAAVGALASWTLPFRGLSPGGVLLRQTVRVGGWLGVRRDATMTPEEYAAEIGRVAPTAREPARYVARLYAAERYGGHPLSGTEARSGQRALRMIRRSLLRAVARREKALGEEPGE